MKFCDAPAERLFPAVRVVRLVLITALFCAVAACDAKDSSAVLPYPVYDSGMLTPGGAFSIAQIAWIDDRRIVFETVKDNDKRRKTSGPFKLSLWEVGKKVSGYTEYFSSVSVCVQDGMIYRTQKDADGNVRRFYGKFGEEKPIDFSERQGAFFNALECKPSDNAVILAKRKNNRAIYPLLERHGYLEMGAIRGPESLKDENVLLQRPDRNGPIVLSVHRTDIRNLRYYQFKDAYFTPRVLGSYAVTTNKPAITRWLYPDGRIEEVPIPVGPWADLLIGGFGNDILNGLNGDDTYLFDRGDGQDNIVEPLSSPPTGNRRRRFSLALPFRQREGVRESCWPARLCGYMTARNVIES